MDLLFGASVGAALFLVSIALFRRYPASWRTAGVRQSAVGAALVSLAVAFASWHYDRQTALYLAAFAVVLSVPLSLHRANRANAIERALAGLRVEAEREQCRRALVGLVGKPSGFEPYSRWARTVTYVAAGAVRAGFHEDGLYWCERLDRRRLDFEVSASRAQIMAAAFVALRDRKSAREVIASVPRPVRTPVWERALTAMTVLLDALEGDFASAEVRAREGLARETELVLKQTWRAARAHALAALERRDEAMQELRDLRTDDAGNLERIARHGGPASPLAEALMAEGGAPYR